MGIANYHEAICVMGMNRIRAGYLRMAPDLEPYFVMGTTDDRRGFELTQAMGPGISLPVQMLASSPLLVSVINGVLAGAIAALATLQLGGSTALAIGLSVVAFALVCLAFLLYARSQISQTASAFTSLFPTRPDDGMRRPIRPRRSSSASRPSGDPPGVIGDTARRNA